MEVGLRPALRPNAGVLQQQTQTTLLFPPVRMFEMWQKTNRHVPVASRGADGGESCPPLPTDSAVNQHTNMSAHSEATGASPRTDLFLSLTENKPGLNNKKIFDASVCHVIVVLT